MTLAERGLDVRQMDLGAGLAKVLAPLVTKALGTTGRTRPERRDELLRDVTAADDANDLVLRHFTRAATWGILLAIVWPATLVALAIQDATTGSADGVLLVASTLVSFTVFFTACVHAVKGIVAFFVLESWWDRDKLAWRAAMLWQTPDLVVATIAAAFVTAAIA